PYTILYNLYEDTQMSFNDLKKKSKMGSLTEKLIKQVEKLNSGSREGDDERFWKPTLNKKTETGYAVIRFLPAGEGWDDEYVQAFSHAFQGPGGQWFIENCPTTIGRKCACCEHNSKDWATGDKQKQNIVRDRKRKLSYYANVYVIKDPDSPENEGTVRIFKFGKKIFEKIEAALKPKFQDDTPINPFDFWEGADFKLKVLKKDGYWNYDSSEFSNPTPLLGGDDDDLKEVYEKLHNLNEFVDPEKFKSYEDLQARLDKVLGNAHTERKKVDPELQEEIDEEYEEIKTSKSSKKSTLVEEDDDEDTDDALDYFSKLASM
ncbi:MAG: hypothetical protein ABFC34_03520, partial [Methanobacterium sp.]